MVRKADKKRKLKQLVRGKDGKGGAGGGISSEDSQAIAPYKSGLYKRMRAVQQFRRIAKLEGLDDEG